MLEKPKRPTKPKIQDRLQPTTIEELIRKYDLENKGVYDFLDKMVDYINNKNSIMEVGDIFLTTNSTNPGTRFGGTWELIAKGRTLVGVDPDDEDFNEVGKTGGEKTHILTIEETPNHRHEKLYSNNNKERKAGYGSTGTHTGTLNENTATDFESLNTGYTGGDQAHNNLQPYITCYIWKRIE